MQQDSTTSAQAFRDYGEGAGLGSLIWGAQSQFFVRYFHYVVAGFTALILLLIIFPSSWPLGIAIVASYLLYVMVRKLFTRRPSAERKFYRPNVQFLRAELGWLTITALLFVVPGSANSPLWLLYVPVLMLASRHCRTELLIILYLQSAGTLILAQAFASSFSQALLDPYLWAEVLVMGLLAYMIHYLVRNIQARDRTISGYSTVRTLLQQFDLAEPTGAVEWRPMLTTLLNHLEAECVSVWMVESKTRQIRRVASVRHNGREGEWLESNGNTADGIIPFDSTLPLADAIRTGEFRYGRVAQQASTPLICGNVTDELILPIGAGNGPHRVVIGALGVGFRPHSFQKHLLAEYREFIEGLLAQARPMLAYARRLDDLLALQKIGRQVSHSLDLDEVLDSILQTVVDTLGFEFAVISLVDEDKRLIRSKRGINVPQQWLDMSIHSLDSKDIQADIVRTGQTQVIGGWDERFDRRIWEQFGHSEVIRVFTPIEVADLATHQVRIIGTIEAGYHLATRREISSDQLRMLEAFKDQAALAIEHAQLMQRARQRADILTSLHTVGQTVASAREQEQVLDVIVRSAAQLLGADIVMVYRYHRDQNKIDPPAVYGNIWGKYRLNLDLKENSILTRQLHAAEPYYSADAAYEPDLMFHSGAEGERPGKLKDTFTRRQNIKSLACLPLIAHGETVGIMFVNYRSRHQLGPDERQVHELFAQQAAVAIKNSKSYELARELIIRQERDHLSRELHHTVSQSLFGIKLQAQNAIRHLPPEDEATRVELTNILENAHVASVETGFILDELRAPIAESQHLLYGLQEYARRSKKWYNHEVEIDYIGQAELPPHTQETLLRFAREALNNAVRHSKSKIIQVSCESNEYGVKLTVCDEGIGFDPDRVAPNKLGLLSMRELATAAYGFFELQTAPQQGTRVTLTIPPDAIHTRP